MGRKVTSPSRGELTGGDMRRSVRAVGAAVEVVHHMLPNARADGLVIVAYHRIDDGGGGLAISSQAFRSQLDWLEQSGIPVVDPSDTSHAQGQAMRVALTFDDGYRSVADIAWPELRTRNWPATLYVASRALDDQRPFAWDVGTEGSTVALVDRGLVRELADQGMSIGSHTRTHRYLPGLPSAEIARELKDSRRELEDVVGQAVLSFSYPMGGWNRSIRQLVEDAGYRTAVTMDRGRNLPGQDPLLLRRQPTDADPKTFARTIMSCYDFLRPIDRWRGHRSRALRTVSSDSD
jgi:peptidoglycan/xylan/chitin deacetylase (PgdA/CDA1 family)